MDCAGNGARENRGRGMFFEAFRQTANRVPNAPNMIAGTIAAEGSLISRNMILSLPPSRRLKYAGTSF
jgi:hypothetical protein